MEQTPNETTPEEPVELIESTEDDQKRPLPAWVKYVSTVLIAAVIALYLYSSGWGGYAVAYVKCGVAKPLIASTIDNAKLYYTPDNRRYSAPGEGVLFDTYYCTEAQAKAAGFLRAGP